MLSSTAVDTPLTSERERPEYLLRLADLTRADAGRAGMKAASLGELVRAGFPVPDGFVVSTHAFDRFLSANVLGPDSAPEAVALAPLPLDLAEAIRSAVRPFDGAPLAVRSSGAAEDLPGASFAGQYQTFLDVRGPEAVLDAVRRCWASVFAAHVAAYRGAKNGNGGGGMAVLVQRLVAADRAGVVFSANPVDGDRSSVVVNASWGLGEAIVGGLVNPDVYVVSKRDFSIVNREVADKHVMTVSLPEGGTREQPVPLSRRRLPSLSDAEAKDLAWIAARLEARNGYPVDVEFAFAGPRLAVLQCRPITAL